MRMETLLTHELGCLSTLIIQIRLVFPSLLHCVLNVVCMFFVVLFSSIYNEWFVTRRSRSSGIVLPAARCVRPCQHVEASNNLSITLLPIRNVLILNRGY